MPSSVTLVIAGVLLLAAYLAGRWDGTEIEVAKALREQRIAQITRDEAKAATAAEIAKLKPRNESIRQQAQAVVQANPVYRDCALDDDGLRIVNEALTGRRSSAAGVRVPASGPSW